MHYEAPFVQSGTRATSLVAGGGQFNKHSVSCKDGHSTSTTSSGGAYEVDE